MSRRRENRVAVSAFRHHSYIGIYEDEQGETRHIRYIEQQALDLEGEYDEIVYQADMVQVLKTELPDHDTSRSRIRSLDTDQVFILGREIKDDGYIRTIEVSKE